MNEKKKGLFEKEGVRKVCASLISILVGLLVGAITVFIVGICKNTISLKGAWEGVRIVLAGIFSTGRTATGTLTWGYNSVNIGNMLFRATPLIMTGLSVAVAFKTGLFNIGAPGQYLMGTMTSLAIALSIPSDVLPEWIIRIYIKLGIESRTPIPTWFIWILAFLGAVIAGALWGAIPGLVKAIFNINEVIACIMTNWIAANVVTWFFDGSIFCNQAEAGKTGYIYKTSYNDIATTKLGLDKVFEGSQVNGGFIFAILIAIAMYIMMNKTTFGFQLKACGSNRHAAKYAGIKDKRNIVLSMAISGALAATGAAFYTLAGNTEFFWSTYQSLPAIGFNGIPVALLALNNPIGVVFAGLFMAMLNIVGSQLTYLTAYNEYITDVIIAVIVYLSAFSLLISMWLSGKKKKKEVKVETQKEEPKPEEKTETQVSENKGEGVEA